ncbi:hypothetical protein T439DRAFT_347952 [Meredithblackwellia eburnea MCA 4105]
MIPVVNEYDADGVCFRCKAGGWKCVAGEPKSNIIKQRIKKSTSERRASNPNGSDLIDSSSSPPGGVPSASASSSSSLSLAPVPIVPSSTTANRQVPIAWNKDVPPFSTSVSSLQPVTRHPTPQSSPYHVGPLSSSGGGAGLGAYDQQGYFAEEPHSIRPGQIQVNQESLEPVSTAEMITRTAVAHLQYNGGLTDSMPPTPPRMRNGALNNTHSTSLPLEPILLPPQTVSEFAYDAHNPDGSWSGMVYDVDTPLLATGMEWISGSEMDWFNSFAASSEVIPVVEAFPSSSPTLRVGSVSVQERRTHFGPQVAPPPAEDNRRPSVVSAAVPVDFRSLSLTQGIALLAVDDGAIGGHRNGSSSSASSSSSSLGALSTSRDQGVILPLHHEGPFAEATRPETLVSRMEKQMKEQTDHLLVKFYREHLVPAWSGTYPTGIRELQEEKCYTITAKFDITRQAAKVAAAAYINLLQKGLSHPPHHGYPLPQTLPPELRNLRLDPIRMLEEALASFGAKDPDMTLEAQLWALSDLHISLGAMGIPSLSNQIVEMAIKLLTFAFGPSPTISLSHLKLYSNYAIHAFAMIDWARSMAQRRRTFLRFSYGDGGPNGVGVPEGREGVEMGGLNGDHENWFGLPGSLAILVVEAANLSARAQEQYDSPHPQSSSQLHLESSELLQRLESWRPDISVYDQGALRHPLSMAAEMTVQQETWRQTGQLLIHRVVFRRSPSHTHLSTLIDKIIGSLKAILVLNQGRRAFESKLIDWWLALYTAPAFLVGTLVEGSDERRFCKRFIRCAGEEPPLDNMIRLMEETWDQSDREGRCVDWFDVAQQRGNDIVFF